jgi:hypothetical protein
MSTPGEQGHVPPSEFLALARSAYDSIEAQVRALEDKARTYLTVNSLLVTAGLLSIAKGDYPSWMGCASRTASSIFGVFLLASVSGACWCALRVLSVRRFQGPPNPASTMADYANRPLTVLHASLAVAFGESFETNRRLGAQMAEDLKRAMAFTRAAFAAFVLVLLVFVLSSIGVAAMPSPQNQPAPAPNPGPPPIQVVPIDKGLPPK